MPIGVSLKEINDRVAEERAKRSGQQVPLPTDTSPPTPDFGGGYSGLPPSPAYGQQYANGTFNGWQLPVEPPKRAPTLDAQGNLLNKYKLDVTSDRPESAWLRMQLQRQGLEEQRGLGLADKDAAINRANVMSSAAQLGGASSGAAERLGSRFAKDAALQQQDIRSQGAWGRLGLRESDLQRQIGGDQYNIQQALGQVQQAYGADSDTFNTLAQAYSAEQLANAMGGGGGGGGGGKVGIPGAVDELGKIINPWGRYAEEKIGGPLGEAISWGSNPSQKGVETYMEGLDRATGGKVSTSTSGWF